VDGLAIMLLEVLLNLADFEITLLDLLLVGGCGTTSACSGKAANNGLHMITKCAVSLGLQPTYVIHFQ